MKNTTFKFLFLAVLGLGVIATSCKKNENNPDRDTTLSQDDALAQSIYDNVTNITDEAYSLKSSNLKSTEDLIFIGPCATIWLDTTVDVHTIIIDFGDENCLCNDGRYRRGKILVSFTGRYWHPGTVITTGFDNYFVNDNQVDGTKVVTNMGPNDSGHPVFNIDVTGVIYLDNDGGTLSWNSERTREMVEGYDTHTRWDDVYLITGNANGIRPNGITWDTEIVNPLRRELVCRFIVSGTVNITPQGLSTRIFDFGDGECDNIATITIEGATYTIYLH
jgi:hypothetical protein